MSSTKALEITGKLEQNPLAELLAETFSYNLSGSFRLSNESRKVIIYLRNGNVVFAVSNLRQHRLFELLLNVRQITKESLYQFENVANDLEFGQKLVEKGLFSQVDVDILFAEQLKQVLQEAITWKSGDWNFTPFARIKSSINFEIDLLKILFDFARSHLGKDFSQRLNIAKGEFELCKSMNFSANLMPYEGYILSRLDHKMSFEAIRNACGLSDEQTSQGLYTLWLGRLIKRVNFDSGFTSEQFEMLSSAKFKLSEAELQKPIVDENTEPNESEINNVEKLAEVKTESIELTFEEYLTRSETAVSHYEMLGIEQSAELSEVKSSYFSLAKRFHPDKFHNEDDDVKKKLQQAFSRIAHAYDTLKDTEQRELYDFRLKRKIAELEESAKIQSVEQAKQTPTSPTINAGKLDLAKTYFEQGFTLLMANETEKAIPFLANSANLAPNVARYHAYYGKSLIGNKKFRHRAEEELLAAVKIEPENSTFRVMLIEFYIEFNLLKRAEGEARKLLEIDPNSREAKTLLDKIVKK